MQVTTALLQLAAQPAPAEHGNELPMDPIWFGVVAFVLFVLALLALLVFGKGRPHS